MVKPDVKHDYYRDLDLPSTASIDDIKKQYRKLALLYHPDRNAGKEEEYVPRFQAIQTAHEVLGDANLKNKYDADRRKAGMPFRSNTFGNPYAASAAYPPPPRRTQPGQWQRPPPFSAASATAAGATPTGAERFTNFTARPAPTARKDPAQDRTNMFKAWQNMNSAQDRQQRSTPSGAAPPPTQPSPSRPRPPPPPRADAKMPSEEEIRAGMNYRKAPPPQSGGDDFEMRRSAWESFQQNRPAKAGVNRSKTMKTPKKQGFDPNAPGSDERPAAFGGYSQRHRSEDHGQSKNGQAFPAPPPRPPPHSPLTPSTSPTSQQRPSADPLRQFKSRMDDNLSESQVPFAEGNRKRTPYSSLSGEKTSFNRDSGEGLRRSASTRDATKLNVNGTGSGRARSTSPLGRSTPTSHPEHAHESHAGVNSSDSDGNPVEAGGMPTTGNHQSGTGPSQRPMKIPTPPSRRFNGSTNPFTAPPTDGTQSDTEGNRPNMQQNTSSNNMYVPFTHVFLNSFPFYSEQGASGAFASHDSTSSAGKKRKKQPRKPSMYLPPWECRSRYTYEMLGVKPEPPPGNPTPELRTQMKNWPQEDQDLYWRLAADTKYVNATEEQRAACDEFRTQIIENYGYLPKSFDMDVFLKLVSIAAAERFTRDPFVDSKMAFILSFYPNVAAMAREGIPEGLESSFTDDSSSDDSFSFPYQQDIYSPGGAGKSRSEENINTTFSPDGWNGAFTGAADYFAPPPQTASNKKAPSPSRRQQKNGRRSVTTPNPAMTANGATEMPPSPTASGLDDNQQDDSSFAEEVKFSKEQWEKTFQDASWTYPTPKPPSPTKVTNVKARGRKASKASGKNVRVGADTKQQPCVADEDGAAGNVDRNEDVDAMDIDSTPPSIAHPANVAESQQSTPTQPGSTKGPRMYPARSSTWKQQQQQPPPPPPPPPQQQQQAETNGHQRRSSDRAYAGDNLNISLEDLASVAPFNKGTAETSDRSGLKDFTDLSSSLPFPSAASKTLPTQPLKPEKLQLPHIPKPPPPPNRLTKESWHTYVRTFGSYLNAYHTFNNTMLQHFVTREEQVRRHYLACGTAWLEASGDVAGAEPGQPSGFGSYLQGVREDEQVREAWSLGCERHQEAVKAFDKMRERLMNISSRGVLADR